MTAESISYEVAVEKACSFFAVCSRLETYALMPRGIHEPGSLRSIFLAVEGAKKIREAPTELLRLAKSDVEAFDALMFGIAHCVVLDQKMPECVRIWHANFLRGRVSRPSSKSGSKSHLLLHISICHCVIYLERLGLYATKSDGSDPRSACDAVAAALRKQRLTPSTYDGVKAIYLKFRRYALPNGQIHMSFVDFKPVD